MAAGYGAVIAIEAYWRNVIGTIERAERLPLEVLVKDGEREVGGRMTCDRRIRRSLREARGESST